MAKYVIKVNFEIMECNINDKKITIVLIIRWLNHYNDHQALSDLTNLNANHEK